jgi:hypothetical protein
LWNNSCPEGEARRSGLASAAAFLGVVLDAVILVGIALLARVWLDLRPHRPGSLTLTPVGLISDPGHWHFPNCVSSGKHCEIGRSEVGEIRLDRVGPRQRLTIDRSVERVEIGAGLREPEREWLAGLLRAWAGPGPQPAEREEAHVAHNA